jgi:hypothetical protein
MNYLGVTTRPLALVARVIATMSMAQPAYSAHVVQPRTPDDGVHLVMPMLDGERGRESFGTFGGADQQ